MKKPADILINYLRSKNMVSMSAITPKGQEWILLNCSHDQPIIEDRQIFYLKYLIERDGLVVEVDLLGH